MKIFSKVRRKIRNILKSFQEERRFRENAIFVKKLSAASPASRKLIIDCGFNQGIVAARLLDELVDFSLIGFEVQQDIQKFAYNLRYRFPGREIKVIYSAIADHDGTIEYFEPKIWGKNYKGGTTTIGNKQSMVVKYDEPLLAPSVNFSKWLQENLSDDYFVFVKMDIEGAEYDVIEHLISTGAIDKIDVLAVEWHAEKFPEPLRTKYLDIEKAIKQYAKGHQLAVLDWY